MRRCCRIIVMVLAAAPACAPVIPATAPPPDSQAPVCTSHLPALDRSYTTVGQALRHLKTLERTLLEDGDLRAAFVSVYAQITRVLEAAIENHQFQDAEWVSSLTVTFANLYRQALFNFECGRLSRVPGAWRLAFDTALSGRANALQAVVLSINAHVNHDLALALFQASIATGRELRHQDHALITRILVREIDAVQERLADLYDPALTKLDKRFWRFDETWVASNLDSWREGAWEAAVKLTDDQHPGAMLWALEVGSTARGQLLNDLFRTAAAP